MNCNRRIIAFIVLRDEYINQTSKNIPFLFSHIQRKKKVNKLTRWNRKNPQYRIRIRPFNPHVEELIQNVRHFSLTAQKSRKIKNQKLSVLTVPFANSFVNK